MRNKKIWLSGLLAVACMGLTSVLIVGCEEAKGIHGIELVPPSASLGVTINGGTNLVNFTALISSDLSLPLKWSVANAALGTITFSGSNAVYVANPQPGDNIVTVRDQHDNEGSAVVHQF